MFNILAWSLNICVLISGSRIDLHLMQTDTARLGPNWQFNDLKKDR